MSDEWHFGDWEISVWVRALNTIYVLMGVSHNQYPLPQTRKTSLDSTTRFRSASFPAAIPLPPPVDHHVTLKNLTAWRRCSHLNNQPHSSTWRSLDVDTLASHSCLPYSHRDNGTSAYINTHSHSPLLFKHNKAEL